VLVTWIPGSARGVAETLRH